MDNSGGGKRGTLILVAWLCPFLGLLLGALLALSDDSSKESAGKAGMMHSIVASVVYFFVFALLVGG